MACGGSKAKPPENTPRPNPFSPVRSVLTSLPVGYQIETVLDGLAFPTAIAATPDGRLLITEQTTGRVRVVQNGRLLDEPWAEFPVYFAENEFLQELGLDSIAVDPKFDENHYVYVYYTQRDLGDGRRTVFVRLTDIDNHGADPKVLVSIDLAPKEWHVAGGIAFLKDAILLGIGDHEQAHLARDLTSIAGKVVRIDREGNPPLDNPFVRQQGVDPRIYAYGMRNPFGIAVDRVTGRAFFGENRDTAGDAVYELLPATSYGWPDAVALRAPLVIYDEPQGLAGMIVYREKALAAFDGKLFFCTFHAGGGLHWLDPDATGSSTNDHLVAAGCATGVTAGADGFIYFLSYGDGKLLRISAS